jgi:hypothetical protein
MVPIFSVAIKKTKVAVMPYRLVFMWYLFKFVKLQAALIDNFFVLNKVITDHTDVSVNTTDMSSGHMAIRFDVSRVSHEIFSLIYQ